MNFIKTSVKDKTAIISLDRGKSNALHHEMISELISIFEDIENDPNLGAAIITGHDDFFSAGLDLITLYHYNEDEIRAFWKHFLDFIAKLIAFKKPLIAAINGHSPAGGCVIALAADYRIMAEGSYIVGLNEVPVGIVVPHSIFELYAFWLGKANAYRFLLEGRLFSPEEALKVGLVDDLAKPKKLLQMAEKQAQKYQSFEQNTWQQSKLGLRQNLISEAQNVDEEMLERVLKQWWSQGTRTILKSLVDKLQKK
jgi:enoyl-CoA hydratase/carnithine racemase